MKDGRKTNIRTIVEIALIFAVFWIQGAWPVPDVNEPHYLAKAAHYWNPDAFRGDSFTESADTHQVFDFVFGWLSLWLSPFAMAWTGRVVTWLLLAWSWQRLSAAIVPRAWFSPLTAALFVCMTERCHMAGEWIIGGVEAKGFAYVFVFLGLESLVRNRWNRALVLFGIASTFHVLVGGWSAVAAGIAWLWLSTGAKWLGRCRCGDGQPLAEPPPLRSLWPGIVLGLLLALPGLWPSLTLDVGVDPKTTAEAHRIYVFDRLYHHLTLVGIRSEFIWRLGVLWGFWLLLGPWSKKAYSIEDKSECMPTADRQECLSSLYRLRAFVAGAVVITLIGVALHLLLYVDRKLAADVLRYYWFRLTDVALPLGVALEGVALINRVRWRRYGLIAAVGLAAYHLGDMGVNRIFPPPAPRSHKLHDYPAWLDVCRWVSESGRIPPDARFLTPRLTQTFKWHTGRIEVATWKDVPQNARAIVEWWHNLDELYATHEPPPALRWHVSQAELDTKQLKQFGVKYKADYLLTETTHPPLDLPVLYSNRTFTVYQLR